MQHKHQIAKYSRFEVVENPILMTENIIDWLDSCVHQWSVCKTQHSS